MTFVKAMLSSYSRATLSSVDALEFLRLSENLTSYGLDKWDKLASSPLKVTVRPIELVAARPIEHVAAPPTYGPLDAWVTRGPSPV